MFLTSQQTAATNRHVHNGPENSAPSFKLAFPNRLDISGGILRYSTTTPDVVKAVPGGFRITPGPAAG